MKRSSQIGTQTDKSGLVSPRQVFAHQTWIEFILGHKLLRPLADLLTTGKFLERLAVLFFSLGVLVTLIYAIARPAYNWDMVAYVATALEDEYPNTNALHAETWKLINAGASEAQRYHLKQSNTYNLHQWENPEDFRSQLVMYRIKVGYIALLNVLEPIVGLVHATRLLSLVPSLVFGGLCLWWLRREQALQGAFLLFPLLLLAGYLSVTLVVTPDMLVSSISLIAIYCVYRKHDWSAALLLLLTVFIRPDNFVLIIALTISAFLFGWKRWPMVLTFFGALVVMSVMTKTVGHPGWWPHFYFSTVHIQNSMTDFHPAFSFAAFAKGYLRGVAVSFLDNDWPFLCMLLLATWAMLYRAGFMSGPRVNGLCFAMVIGVLGKFASFPLPDDRYYFVFIAGLMLLLISAWKPQFQIMALTKRS